MSDTKNVHAVGWGVGGTALAIGSGIGMIFTGPVGWVVLGTCAGVGSGVAVSSVQQACDSS